jgi:hypothetical protein
MPVGKSAAKIEIATGKLHAMRLKRLEAKINDVLSRADGHVNDTMGLSIDKYSVVRFREIAKDKYHVMDQRKRKDFDKLIDNFHNGISQKIDALEILVKNKHFGKSNTKKSSESDGKKKKTSKTDMPIKILRSRKKTDVLRHSGLRVRNMKRPKISLYPEKIAIER